MEPLKYSDTLIGKILGDTRTIAMVGASANWVRPSYFAMKPFVRGLHDLGHVGVAGSIPAAPTMISRACGFSVRNTGTLLARNGVEFGVRDRSVMACKSLK